MKLGNTPDLDLRDLAKLLEAGGAIPSDLAQRCAALIREAVDNGGKLNLGLKRGQPPKLWERTSRAIKVAILRERQRMTVREAAQVVADECGLKRGTVEKDYKIYGKNARTVAKFTASAPAYVSALNEFRTLLGTFRHDDGRYFDDADIDEICERIPARLIPVYVDRIYAGGIRRDPAMLREILSN